jgi:hypothetical protein
MGGQKHTAMYDADTMRRLTTASAALVFCGILLFFYAMFASDPALQGAALSLRASLLGGEIVTPPGRIPPAPDAVFLTGCVLIIAGAVLDVWRRLHVSSPHCPGGISQTP